jgi:SAM-dependent methyltransferase
LLTVDYDRLGLQRGELLLDLGCGGGRHAVEGARRGARVVALDLEEEAVSSATAVLAALDGAAVPRAPGGPDQREPRAPGRGVAARADAGRLPFPDAVFDRVIAAEVLEHIAGDRPVMAELARVLRPGGTMAVTVPRFAPELVNWALSDRYHARPGGHVRIYRRSQLLARLEDVGLRYVGSHHTHGLHTPYWWLRCLVGVDRDRHPAVAAYHRLLVWDLMVAPRITRAAEAVLTPAIGKSLVVYLEREGR